MRSVHIHRNWMIASSSLGLVTALVAFATRRQDVRAARWVLAAMMAATVVVSTLGADRGAALIFRNGIGAPDRARDDSSRVRSKSDGEAAPHGH